MEVFTIEIEIGNDRMQTPADVVGAVRAVCDRMMAAIRRSGKSGWLAMMAEINADFPVPIRDANGNTVGCRDLRDVADRA